MNDTHHRIGEAARIARVSVRTLHHYDAIGLLRPSQRSSGDYRLYSRADLERLHQIRLYRTLGLSLDEIARVLDDPGHDARAALREHRERLAADVEERRAMIATIDRMLERAEDVADEELFAGFEEEALAREAEERFGDTPQWKESQRRRASYDEATMAAIRDEHEELLGELAEALREGAESSSERAMDLAERARLHIDRWFYPLSREGHVALSGLYLQDPRFTETYERVETGLASYVVEAIAANAARA